MGIVVDRFKLSHMLEWSWIMYLDLNLSRSDSTLSGLVKMAFPPSWFPQIWTNFVGKGDGLTGVCCGEHVVESQEHVPRETQQKQHWQTKPLILPQNRNSHSLGLRKFDLQLQHQTWIWLVDLKYPQDLSISGHQVNLPDTAYVQHPNQSDRNLHHSQGLFLHKSVQGLQGSMCTRWYACRANPFSWTSWSLYW